MSMEVHESVVGPKGTRGSFAFVSVWENSCHASATAHVSELEVCRL
jgi:hypothetical protein